MDELSPRPPCLPEGAVWAIRPGGAATPEAWPRRVSLSADKSLLHGRVAPGPHRRRLGAPQARWSRAGRALRAGNIGTWPWPPWSTFSSASRKPSATRSSRPPGHERPELAPARTVSSSFHTMQNGVGRLKEALKDAITKFIYRHRAQILPGGLGEMVRHNPTPRHPSTRRPRSHLRAGRAGRGPRLGPRHHRPNDTARWHQVGSATLPATCSISSAPSSKGPAGLQRPLGRGAEHKLFSFAFRCGGAAFGHAPQPIFGGGPPHGSSSHQGAVVSLEGAGADAINAVDGPYRGVSGRVKAPGAGHGFGQGPSPNPWSSWGEAGRADRPLNALSTASSCATSASSQARATRGPGSEACLPKPAAGSPWSWLPWPRTTPLSSTPAAARRRIPPSRGRTGPEPRTRARPGPRSTPRASSRSWRQRLPRPWPGRDGTCQTAGSSISPSSSRKPRPPAGSSSTGRRGPLRERGRGLNCSKRGIWTQQVEERSERTPHGQARKSVSLARRSQPKLAGRAFGQSPLAGPPYGRRGSLPEQSTRPSITEKTQAGLAADRDRVGLMRPFEFRLTGGRVEPRRGSGRIPPRQARLGLGTRRLSRGFANYLEAL